jgi:Mrp family chromosome partitioning ATPase
MTGAQPIQNQGAERQLDVIVERLSPMADNPAARALLIEARRLRSVIDNWRSVPPAAHLREELLARVMHLSAAVSDLMPASNSRPPMSMTGTFNTNMRLPTGLNSGGPEETIITEGTSALPETPLDVLPVKISDDLSSHLAMLKDPFSPRADAYRALRHQLSKRGDPRVVGVTSPGRREGKTTAAINLAASLREGALGRSQRA